MLILTFVFGIATVGCDIGSTNEIANEDSVRIISVTPSTDLIDGVEQLFTILVDWRLSSLYEGQLAIGFNTEEWHSWPWSSIVIVERGSGQQTFTEIIVPRNYYPETGRELDFAVMVNLLSLHPSDDGNYRLLDLDIMSLRFK